MPTYRITDPISQKTLRITGDKPPTEKELDEIFQRVRGQEAPPEQPKKGLFGRIGESLGKRATGVVDTFKETASGKINPLETGLRVVGDVAGAAGDVIGEGLSSGAKALLNTATLGNADKIGSALANSEIGKQALGALQGGMEAYDTWKKGSETNRRVGEVLESLVDISSFIPAGRVAKTAGTAATRTALAAPTLVSKTGSAIERLGVRAAGQVTSIDGQTLKQVIKNPKAFGKEGVANYTREPFREQIVSVYKKLDDKVGEGGKIYEKIRESAQTVEIPQTKILDTLSRKYGVQSTADTTGNIRLSYQGGGRTNLDPGDIKALETFINTYKGDVFDVNKSLNARMALSDMAGYGGNVTKNVQLVANDLRQNVFDDAMKKGIKGLREIDTKFAPERKALEAFRKEYFVRDGGTYRLADNAISKLANLTGKGKEEALKRIKPLIPNIEEQINVSKAIENIKELAEKRVVGAYGSAATGAIGGTLGFAAGGVPGAIAGAVISSAITDPLKVIPIVRAYGLAKNMAISPLSKVGVTIQRMKKGLPLTIDQKDILSGALLMFADQLKNQYEQE